MKKSIFTLSFLAFLGLGVFTSCSDGGDKTTTGTTTTTTGTTTTSTSQTVSTTALTDATSDVLSSHSFGNTVTIALSGTTATVTNNVSGVTVTNGSGIINITSTASGVEYVLSGSYSGSVNIVSSQIAKVTLNGATITTGSGVSLNFAAPKVFVNTASGTTNTLSSTPTSSTHGTIYNSGKLVFVGSGTLNVTSSAYNGIYCLAGITASETTFNVTSALDGIKTIDNPITLNSGTYTIKTVARGIRTISSSSDYATSSSTHNIIVNGGTYNITATGDDGEGFKAYATLTINSGTINVSAYDDAFSANVDIAITGGTIYGSSTASDAFDSNGTIHVSGGTAIGVAVNTANVAFDCDQNDFVITGGTLIGLGSDNISTPTSASTQPSVLLDKSSSSYRFGSTLLNVQSTTGGSQVLTYQIPQSYTTLFVSSPNFTTGTSYTIYTGGSTTGTATNGLYSGGTYTKGTSKGTFTTATAAPYLTSL